MKLFNPFLQVYSYKALIHIDRIYFYPILTERIITQNRTHLHDDAITQRITQLLYNTIVQSFSFGLTLSDRNTLSQGETSAQASGRCLGHICGDVDIGLRAGEGVHLWALKQAQVSQCQAGRLQPVGPCPL